MRVEFVQCVNRDTAERRCPWAAVVTKVAGGYRCFESVYDYQVWAGQI